MKGLEIALCMVLAGIFLVSSMPKLRSPQGFVLTVMDYQVLPPSMAYLYGWILPPLELLLALLLITGVMVYLATIVTALLYISFLVAVSINIVRGRDLDCHCFGSKVRRRIGWSLVFQDSMLLAITGILAFQTSIQNLLEPWSLFRIVTSGGLNSFLSFLVILGLTGCMTILLRYSKFRGRWSPGLKYSGKQE